MVLPTWKLSFLVPLCYCIQMLFLFRYAKPLYNQYKWHFRCIYNFYLMPPLWPATNLFLPVSTPLLFHDLCFSIAQISSASSNLYNYSLQQLYPFSITSIFRSPILKGLISGCCSVLQSSVNGGLSLQRSALRASGACFWLSDELLKTLPSSTSNISVWIKPACKQNPLK